LGSSCSTCTPCGEGLAAAWTFRCRGLRLPQPFRQPVKVLVELVLEDPLVLQRGRGLLRLELVRLRLLDPGEQFQQAVGGAQE
jgi:hypothetical protein